jgi:hypothetical protein
MFGFRRRMARRTSRRVARRWAILGGRKRPGDAETPLPTSSVERKDPYRLADLERLARLREQGILTEQEYLREKNRILGT